MGQVWVQVVCVWGGGSQVTLPGVGTGGIQSVGWYAGLRVWVREKKAQREWGEW